MSKAPQYRHELKYYINQGAYTLLSKKLSLSYFHFLFPYKL